MRIVAERNPDKVRQEALDYLSKTDWYIIRQDETKKPTPESVLQKRAEARQKVSERASVNYSRGDTL